MRELLEHASQRAIAYLESLEKRAVAPDPQAIRRLADRDISLLETGADPIAVFDRLDEIGSAATVASAGSPLLMPTG